MNNDSQLAKEGAIIGLLAYTMWGLLPIYLKQVSDVSTTEILVHRVIWALPFGALIIYFRRQWYEVCSAFLDKRKLAWLALAAAAISVNWLIYLWAVNNGRIFEASLGYYINPLMYVLVGVLFLGERLRPWQLVAVTLATLAVMILSISHGQVPWAGISLAALFTVYGVIRKQINIGAMPGLFVEILILFPFSIAWLLILMNGGNAIFLKYSPVMDGLLILAGPITVMPLLLFAIAARRLSLTTIGFLQFIGPTLQFLVGLYYGETLTTAYKICFALIWIAVAVFVYDAMKLAKKKPLPIESTGA